MMSADLESQIADKFVACAALEGSKFLDVAVFEHGGP
jgi:ubiquinone/menaquinone biosynthesis C-methylase UbiE